MARSRHGLIWQRSEPEDPTRPSLLTLPTELRLLIIDYLMIRNDTLRNMRPRIGSGGSASPNTPRLQNYLRVLGQGTPMLDIRLMATCRQLHAEAADVFYTRNTFLVDDASPVRQKSLGGTTTVPTIHPQYLDHIRKVETFANCVESNWVHWISICDMLQQWTRVEVLTLRLGPRYFTELYSNFSAVGDDDAATRRLSKQIKTTCLMQDLKPPKQLRVVLELAQVGTLQEQSQLAELQRVADTALDMIRGRQKR